MDYIKQGDCIELLKTIPDKSIDLVLTDIPYGGVNRQSNGLRKLNKGTADTVDFDITELTEEVIRVCKGSIYMFCGWTQITDIIFALDKGGYSTRIVVWEKTNPSPMNGEHIWLSGIELCVFGKVRGATYNGFCENTVLRFPSGNSKLHPTQKPVELFEKLIRQSSKEGDLVLDPFIGSGTTAIACWRTNRHYIGFEKDKRFYEIARQRVAEETAQIKFF